MTELIKKLKETTAIIGHNSAKPTLLDIATSFFAKEKTADRAVKSKEEKHKELLTRLTDDGATAGFNVKLDDGQYTREAADCRLAMATIKGTRAVKVWTTPTSELSDADTKFKNKLTRNIGSKMSKLSKSLDRHQNDPVKLTYTGRLVKGLEQAKQRIVQYDVDKHDEITFDRNKVKTALSELISLVNK